MNNQPTNILATKQQKKTKTKVKNKRKFKAPGKSEIVGNAIKRTIYKAQHFYENAREKFEPFSKYVHMLLHENSPSMITPLMPYRIFTKRVRYQDSIQVNSSGAALIALQPVALTKFNNSSTASPVLYVNQTAYNPDSTTNALTGGWNTSIVGSSGLNITGGVFGGGRVASVHVVFEITGVSNLNKSGTIHLAEQTEANYRYGTSADTTHSEILANNCAISALPKFNKYKSVEIINMSSDSVLEYHYVPLTNEMITQQFVSAGTVTAGNNEPSPIGRSKLFCLIVKGAHVDTIIRARYEINLEFMVNNDYVNDYPPAYSHCFVNSEPTLQLINQTEDYIIRVNAKQGHVDKRLYNEVNMVNSLIANDKLAIPHMANGGKRNAKDIDLTDNVNLFDF
jgi:hypothetical protein